MKYRFFRLSAACVVASFVAFQAACTVPSGGSGDGGANDNTSNTNANDNQTDNGNANTNGNQNGNDNTVDNGNQNGNQNANDNTAGTVSGEFSAVDGLRLETAGFELEVPANANPSSTMISMRVLSEAELNALGLPSGFGFDQGVEFQPSGTTFDQPIEVKLVLATPTVLDTLAVLRYDDAAGTWGDGGVTATVTDAGTRAAFELTGFSFYDAWNPPVPPGTVAIGDGEIIAGTGLFEGQPFNVFANYTNTSASLTYSDFGDVFGLALINLDLENPTTGDMITLTAGLHATEVRRLEAGVILGLVTPAGGLGGPSIYSDGTPSFSKPVAGVMFLRKSATQWIVDVYCHYEGGVIFGQAVGDL